MYVHTVHSRKGKPPTAVYMDGMQTWTHYVGVVEIAVSGNEHTSENVRIYEWRIPWTRLQV